MKKDAYYFPHFSNARNDSKVIKLRRVLGIEGYGIYFMLLEVLREQTDFKLPISNIEDLAYEWHTSKEKLISVINDFDMFEIDANYMFFSPKLLLYLQPYIEKSERARLAAYVRWDKLHANALPVHSKSNTSKVKESKVKEITVKETLEQKQSTFKLEVKEQKQYDAEMLKAFFMYWSEPTKDKKKMRKDLERTWDTSRRLITWNSRQNAK